MTSSEKPGPTGNFEFDALRWAVNYRRALFNEFAPYLTGEVIEVGAGIGQFTELIAKSPGVRKVIAVEPDPQFCAQMRERLPEQALVQGIVTDLQPGTACDAVVSVNVLEHIENDLSELSGYARLLKARRGCLCLFVPARQEIYAPIDGDFGHFRRYSKPELRAKLNRAGFEAVKLHYFNFVGYFAWWFTFCLLGKRGFAPGSVRFFDAFVLPVVHGLERRVMRPPFGQSLLIVARVA